MPIQTPMLPARPVRLIVAGLALALTASGCAQLKGRQGYVVDPVLTTAITPGVDNRESVEKTLGRPTFVGQFSDKASVLGLALAGASYQSVPAAGAKGRKRTVFFVDEAAAAKVPVELIDSDY